MLHPTLVLNFPYSTLAGSVAGEQALQLSHNHTLFGDDNEQFYGILKETVHVTVYEATIKPFQRLADGRGSYLALIAQHAGRYKYIAILRTAKEYMNNRKWDRTTATTMQAHIERCRESYVDGNLVGHMQRHCFPVNITFAAPLDVRLHRGCGCSVPLPIVHVFLGRAQKSYTLV